MVSSVFGVADAEMDLSNRHECPVPGCPATAEAHHLRDTAHRSEIAALKATIRELRAGLPPINLDGLQADLTRAAEGAQFIADRLNEAAVVADEVSAVGAVTVRPADGGVQPD